MRTAEATRRTFLQNLADFASFITSWWPHRQDPNILVVPYEDLKADLQVCVCKIAAFVFGKPLDETALAKILNLCNFEYMFKNKQKFGEHALESMIKQVQTQASPVLCGMVRMDGGKVGQGKQLLDPQIIAHIDQRWKETIGMKFGIRNYQELYKQCTLIQK